MIFIGLEGKKPNQYMKSITSMDWCATLNSTNSEIVYLENICKNIITLIKKMAEFHRLLFCLNESMVINLDEQA